MDEYPILIHEKIFSKVIETDYQKVIKEFNTTDSDIISPKAATDEVFIFDGC